MKYRRVVSTVLSVVLILTQLALPVQRALASVPATGTRAVPVAGSPAAGEPVARAPSPAAIASRGRLLGPQREPEAVAVMGPQDVTSLPIGVGYSNYGQQQRDTDNPQAHPGHAFAGSVNLLNGNLFLTVGDIFLPGRGLSLQFARSYNSLAAVEGIEGALGPGWTHSYETRVISETAGMSLTVVEADGALHEYTGGMPCWDTPMDTCYEAPPGFHRELRDMAYGGYLLTHKNGTFQVFDMDGRLIEIHDRHGNEVSLWYNPSGPLTCPVEGPPGTLCRVADPTATRSLVFAYDDMVDPPRLLSVSESIDGVLSPVRAVAYGYDDFGNLQDAMYPEEPYDTLNYFYDDVLRPHLMTSYYDPRQPAGARTVQAITYDGMNRVDGMDFMVDSFFDVTFEIEFEPPSRGDDDGFLSEPGQGPTEDMRAVEITDGAGQISRVEYDTYGNPTYEGDYFPEYDWWWGKWWWWHPSEFWELAKKVDANGNETAYDYDAWSNTVAVTNAYGQVQQFVWEPPAYEDPGVAYGNVLSATNSLGVTTVYNHDYAGNSVEEIQALGQLEEKHTIFQSDTYGQLVLELDVMLGRATEYSYDTWGNMTVVTDATGSATRYVYDDFGRPVMGTDPAGNSTTYEYDGADRLLVVADALNGATRYVYSEDGRDNLVELGNANGVTTTFSYDPLDRLLAQTDSLGATTVYTYDNANRLVVRTDAEDRATVYTYDAKSRMRRAVSYAAGADTPYQTNIYEYDGAGNLVRMSNADVSLAYTYDALDQRTMVEMWTPVWGMTETLTLDRDPVSGDLASVTGPGGYAVGYEYDSLNRLSVITDPEGRTTSYQYDPGGRLSSVDAGALLPAPAAAVSDYEYDPLNRLVSLTTKTADGETLSYGYSYDPVGNLISEIDLTEVYTYTYDALGRVDTTHGESEGTIGYSYDPVGNRISASGSEVGTTATFDYDDASRLTAVGDASLGYDAMGARTSLAPTTVMAVSGLAPSGGAAPTSAAAVTAASYTYDNDLRLLEVADAAGVTRFIYDPLGALIGYVDADGMAHYFLRDGEDVYVELDGIGAVIAHYTYGAQGVLSMWRDGVPYLLLYDGQGRVRHVMDLPQMQVVHRYGRDLLAPGIGLEGFYLPIRARGAWWFPWIGLMHYGGGVFLDPVYGVFLAKTWPWCYWPFGPFHPWRPVQRWWPWPWPWARPWGWAWPRPWPFLWPWPGAWVRPWLIWPVWPWAFRFWWPWFYWRAWWGWMWWGRWWCWHPWWWWAKWWWWPWWHPWWWWSYWWWPWWWWRANWWWPRWWWWWIWWPTHWWFWWGGWTWRCWWWWWPWPWWWWPWAWPPSIGPPPDFGDAPDPPYPSLRRSNGAAHGTWWYEWLGVSRNGEWDSKQVDRDQYDDGVLPQPLLGTLTFTPTVMYPWGTRYGPWGPLHVHGWIDSNQDGAWSGAEMITNWSGYPGDGVWPAGQPSFGVTQAFNVPASVLGASDLVTLWLRYRLDYAEDWARPSGYVRFGEVEDHALTIARAITPSWNGGTLNVEAVPVVTYPISVTDVMVGIAPTTVITPVWSSTAQLSVADTGNRLQIFHEPFADGQVYTVTLSTGLTADGGYVVGSEFTFTAEETMYVFLPLVVK